MRPLYTNYLTFPNQQCFDSVSDCLRCPMGYELNREAAFPDQDNCVQCPEGSYLARQGIYLLSN